ncbi:MAG: hypothetical protein KJ579_05815 [Verrucomicrobia bacterium]|nr:hypothetical protein [Verrucomicrobiota bacterium]
MVVAGDGSRADAGETAGGDVPVAPIAPSIHGIWTNALVLRTAAAEAVVVPDIGRVCSFAPADGSNVLHVAAVLDPGATGRRGGAGSWRDFGGLWGWPVPEEIWPRIRVEGGSPDALFEGRRWAGRAWRTADGAAVCSMMLDYGAPLNLRVTRIFRLGRIAASLEIRERVERTGPSIIPAGPSIVARIAAPQRLVFPADSEVEPAVRPVAFGPPPAFALTRTPDSVVYHVDLGGEHRIAAATPRPWVAAELPRHMVLLRAAAGDSNAVPRPAAYVHRGAAYAELEIATAGRPLRDGEAIELTVFLECFPEPAGLDARALAVRTRLLAGEGEAAAVP